MPLPVLLCAQDAQLTCACADNGLLLFGDSSGFISLSDRNLHLSWKHKAFRGPVKGVAYVESQVCCVHISCVSLTAPL